MKEPKIILIDICGTIFKSNTTFDFLDYLFLDNDNRYRFFYKIRKLFLWKCFNKILYSLFHLDLTRILALLFLKNYSRTVLLKEAQQFYNKVLVPLINKDVYEYILDLRSQKDNRLILVSATIDVIAEVIACNLLINTFFSTKLRYDSNNICRGSISEDLLGRKSSFLKKENINPPYFLTITDNLDDIDILNLSVCKCLIITNNQKKWISLFPNLKEDHEHYRKIYT